MTAQIFSSPGTCPVFEDGAEVDFEILDIVPYNGSDYAVLLPVDYDDDAEAVILEVLESGEDDEARFVCRIRYKL